MARSTAYTCSIVQLHHNYAMSYDGAIKFAPVFGKKGNIYVSSKWVLQPVKMEYM